MYLVFTHMPGESYHRWLGTLLLCLCDVFRALINSLVCWFIITTDIHYLKKKKVVHWNKKALQHNYAGETAHSTLCKRTAPRHSTCSTARNIHFTCAGSYNKMCVCVCVCVWNVGLAVWHSAMWIACNHCCFPPVVSWLGSQTCILCSVPSSI